MIVAYDFTLSNDVSSDMLMGLCIMDVDVLKEVAVMFKA